MWVWAMEGGVWGVKGGGVHNSEGEALGWGLRIGRKKLQEGA